MANPAVFGDPDHYSRRYTGREDNGGVHINSGIPNLAFATTALAIGGNSWERAGKIWYTALTNRLRQTSNFLEARVATLSAAVDLYGKSTKEYRAVKAGWDKVGVK